MELALAPVLNPPKAGHPIPNAPFRFATGYRERASRFEFEIVADDRLFAYGFAATSDRVVEEWLVEIGERSERSVFERKHGEIRFGDLRVENDDDKQFLRFTAKGTLPNRLFLSECRELNVDREVRGATEIISVLKWFIAVPSILLPDSFYRDLALHVHTNEEFKHEISRYLNCFDTGIQAIGLVHDDFDRIGVSAPEKDDITSKVEAGKLLVRRGLDGTQWLFDRGESGEVRAWKLVALHSSPKGQQDFEAFELRDESDGTKRLLDLAPSMMALARENRVVVIDELDRSLHPEILHSFIANFLKHSGSRHSQLIGTTHDTTLLNQPFVRRDEVWFVEKGADQSSRLVSLEEFKDVDRIEDLQRGYLQGRFGGVPVIKDFSWLGNDDGKGA
jgi:hypothetical protein